MEAICKVCQVVARLDYKVNPNWHNKKQKIFSEKQKGFRDGLSYSTPQKAKKQGETQPRSHPIKKM